MNFFRHVVVECGGVRRVLVTASGIAVLFVPSQGAFLGFWHRVSAFLGLGSLKSTCRCRCTGTNEVSGTSEFLPLEPPVRVTGASKSSLRRKRAKLSRLHIFKGRDLGDGLK